MKLLRFIFIVLGFAFCGNSYAQDLKESEVPKIVVGNFKKKYPDAYVYEWEWKKKKFVYEAEFILKSKRYEAHYTKDGQWVKTEREVKKNEIPQAVWDSLKKSKYADWKIEDQEEHSTPQNELFYEIKIKNNKSKIFLNFLPNGELIDIK